MYTLVLHHTPSGKEVGFNSEDPAKFVWEELLAKMVSDLQKAVDEQVSNHPTE